MKMKNLKKMKMNIQIKLKNMKKYYQQKKKKIIIY